MADFVCEVSLGRGKEVDIHSLPLYASVINNLIQEEDLSKLRIFLKMFTHKQRQAVVHHKVNGNPPLFTAAMQGKLHFVNFLLDDCGADMEMKGIYEVAEDHTKHQVTPLWCAAVADKLEVVKTLVEHGADVNSPSDTDSTPVRSACYMTNIAVIKYLVDHGANINKPNINGGTCLINSVQDDGLCLYLINKGADANAKDNSGNLALHYAIREGRTKTVKCLLKHKSDHTAKNDFGDDALQTAALKGYADIIQVIFEMTDTSRVDRIRANELLGTNLVDEKNDLVAALNVWKKAMELRYTDKEKPILKELPVETYPAYCHCVEPKTVEELSSLYDPDVIHMQALLIRERILGPRHKDTTFGLMYRGAVYADSHRYQRCVDLWKYAYMLRYRNGEPLNQECLFTIQALVKLFWEIQTEVESSATDEKVQVSDVLDVFHILVEEIKSGNELILKDKVEAPMKTTSKMEFHMLLQICLHLMHLFTRLECSDLQRHKFVTIVRDLIKTNPRGCDGETLLHLAVDPKVSLTGEEFYSHFPALPVIKLLVVCRANINAMCNKGNTPLHNAVRFMTLPRPQLGHVTFNMDDDEILSFFLKSGAHVDIVSKNGSTALDEMMKQGLLVSSVNHVTLRCLASRAVMKYNLPYKGVIPVTLEAFVKMHGVEVTDD